MIPTVCGVVAVVLAFSLARIDRLIGDTSSAFLFPGPPEGARSFLGAVITAMISFTGLVFSITVVVLVLTSGQFSPRVLRQFLRDRTIQWSLGLFVATFVYAVFTLREVLGTNGSSDSFVPRIALTGSFLLILGATAQFIAYIHHVVHIIQAASILVRIGQETRVLIEERCPRDPAPDPPEPDLLEPRQDVVGGTPGVILCVHEAELVRRARADGATVVLARRVGDFVPEGADLLAVHGAHGPIDPDDYRHCVAVGDERSMDQDVAFGLRQLVDIASKALSPSVNDPTTACQAIDVLHDLLRRLVTRPQTSGRSADADGTTRLVVPGYSVEDYLRVVLAEVWFYGQSSTQVPDRLRVMLDDLAAVARPEHHPAVVAWNGTVTGTTR